jgi:alpha-tubulin suppressor-like RCC1 family protein
LGLGDDSYDQLGFAPLDPANPAQLVPAQIPGVAGATGVAAGYTHSLALLGDGSVLAWEETRSDETRSDDSGRDVKDGSSGVTRTARLTDTNPGRS